MDQETFFLRELAHLLRSRRAQASGQDDSTWQEVLDRVEHRLKRLGYVDTTRHDYPGRHAAHVDRFHEERKEQ